MMKMSPISKTYKSFTAPDLSISFFPFFFFFSSKPKDINLHSQKQK